MGISLGLTGMIASGKSLALEYFRQLGWETISTDQLAKDALDLPEVQEAVQSRWGSVVMDGSGGVRRHAVAAIVFQNGRELRWLEDLLHPVVRKSWTGIVGESPDQDFVVEIPLLHEKRLEKHFRHVVCLSAPEKLRMARFLAKGGQQNDFEARQSRQLAAGEKEAASDFILNNQYSKRMLFLEVSVLSQRIRQAELPNKPR